VPRRDPGASQSPALDRLSRSNSDRRRYVPTSREGLLDRQDVLPPKAPNGKCRSRGRSSSRSSGPCATRSGQGRCCRTGFMETRQKPCNRAMPSSQLK
jgi:hypothetical protein